MRFADPRKFLEFFDKQLSRGVVGLRHADAYPLGTPFLVVISPPGAPDRLVLEGTVSRVSQRADGAWRLAIEVDQRPEDAAWLEGYVGGLRATLAWSVEEHQVLTRASDGAPTRRPEVVAAGFDDPALSLMDPKLVDVQPHDPFSAATSGEIGELAERLGDMDYYTVLGLERDVDRPGLQQRYHHLTRRFHPDLFHGLDQQLVRQVNQIYRRMNEAYSVLRSPGRRRAYEGGPTPPPGGPNLRVAEEADDQARKKQRIRGVARPGDFYWTRARQVLESARGQPDWLVPALRESARLLRTALYFEPDNGHFRSALDHVESQLPRS